MVYYYSTTVAPMMEHRHRVEPPVCVTCVTCVPHYMLVRRSDRYLLLVGMLTHDDDGDKTKEEG